MPTGTYQVTLATMTTTSPATIQVNDKVTIAEPAWRTGTEPGRF
jgi:hypothetical protein